MHPLRHGNSLSRIFQCHSLSHTKFLSRARYILLVVCLLWWALLLIVQFILCVLFVPNRFFPAFQKKYKSDASVVG